MSFRVFVAHSEKDASLVQKLTATIRVACGLKRTEVFTSSEGSIKPDARFPEAITDALRASEAIVVVLTPNSIWAPWVHFEAGGGHFHRRKALFAVTALGMGPGSLPENLEYYSVRDLSRKVDVRRFLSRLQRVLGVSGRKALRAEKTLIRSASGTDADWTTIKSTTVAEKLGGSPFELHQLIREAKKSIFIAGQNLWSVSAGPLSAKLRREVFQFLRGDEGRSVQILLQTRKKAEVIEAWDQIAPGFAGDLGGAIDGFLKWLKAAKKGRTPVNTTRKKRLDIRLGDLVPVSFDVIDPDSKDGLMVFRHTLHRQPTSDLRPAFVLRGGKSNRAFGSYWSSLTKAFHAAKRLDRVEASA